MPPKSDEKKTENQRKVFEFLADHFKSQEPFTKGELESVTTWQGASFSTYWSKQYKRFFVPAGGNSFRVSCTSSEPFGQVSNRFKRGSGPSGLRLRLQ